MKNNRGSAKTYLILFIILLIAIIGIVLLLNVVKKANKATPLKNENTTEAVEKDEPIIATNFSAPLSDIVGENRFLENYKEEVIYSGTIFNFNCTSYDEDKNVCNAGSGLMNVGTALVPLFTYESDEDNYLKRLDDYYIVVNDNYIILVMNEAGVKKGIAKVYSRDGEFKYDIENVITGYVLDNEMFKGLYPKVEDTTITYYACESKGVKVLSLDLTKPEEIDYLEDIEKVSCN